MTVCTTGCIPEGMDSITDGAADGIADVITACMTGAITDDMTSGAVAGVAIGIAAPGHPNAGAAATGATAATGASAIEGAGAVEGVTAWPFQTGGFQDGWLFQFSGICSDGPAGADVWPGNGDGARGPIDATGMLGPQVPV
jgi:hypothetical protein